MNEQREAESLARWLDSRGEALPGDVGNDVLEAVLALRPDLAPPPRVSIDDILAEVTAGPLAAAGGLQDRGEGARLAAWLDEEEIPEDADDDALEAVFALRPDLAPPPRVSIDDVLADLSAGPLVERAAGHPEHTLPASLGELPEAVVIANNVPSPRRLPSWFLPGMGALLMAAMALLVVMPAAEQAPRGFPQPTRAPAPTLDVPMAEIPPADMPAAARAAADPSLPATTAPPEGGAPAKEERSNTGDGAPLPEALPAAPLRELGYVGQASAGEEAKGAKDASAAPPPPSVAPEAEAISELSAAQVQGAATAGATTQGAAGRSATVTEEDADDWRAPAEAEEAPVVVSRRDESSKAVTRSTATSKPKATSAPAPAAAETSASDERAEAVDSSLARGDTDTAIKQLTVLMRDPDPRVAGEAALRLTQLYRDQGRDDLALETVNRALQIAALPHELRVKLEAVKREIQS